MEIAVLEEVDELPVMTTEVLVNVCALGPVAVAPELAPPLACPLLAFVQLSEPDPWLLVTVLPEVLPVPPEKLPLELAELIPAFD